MKYSHYFREVPKGVTHIDIYRLLAMFGVTDNALGHAIKKLIVPGLRGAKDVCKDVTEARDTLNRWLQMAQEDGRMEPAPVKPKPKTSPVHAEPHVEAWDVPQPLKVREVYYGGNFIGVGIVVCRASPKSHRPVGFHTCFAGSMAEAALIFEEKEPAAFPYPTQAAD